jgi:hypothetical protein
MGEDFAAGNVFHHHVKIGIILERAIEPDNVRVLCKFNDLALVSDVIELIEIDEFLLAHDFDNTVIFGGNVIAEVNVGKGTDANRPDALELAEFKTGDHVLVTVAGAQKVAGMKGRVVDFCEHYCAS